MRERGERAEHAGVGHQHVELAPAFVSAPPSRSSAAKSLMSQGTSVAAEPTARIASSSSSSAPCVRASATTWAPAFASSSATARPMPREAPVTTAMRPSRGPPRGPSGGLSFDVIARSIAGSRLRAMADHDPRIRCHRCKVEVVWPAAFATRKNTRSASSPAAAAAGDPPGDGRAGPVARRREDADDPRHPAATQMSVLPRRRGKRAVQLRDLRGGELELVRHRRLARGGT